MAALARVLVRVTVSGELEGRVRSMERLHLSARVYRQTLKRMQQAWHDAAKQTGAKLVTLLAHQIDGSLHRLEETNTLEPA